MLNIDRKKKPHTGGAPPLDQRLAVFAAFAEQARNLGSANDLAALYYDQGKYAKAEPLQRHALLIYEKALGPDHPEVATSLENFAALLRQTERADEAEKTKARANAIRAKHAEANPIQ